MLTVIRWASSPLAEANRALTFDVIALSVAAAVSRGAAVRPVDDGVSASAPAADTSTGVVTVTTASEPATINTPGSMRTFMMTSPSLWMCSGCASRRKKHSIGRRPTWLRTVRLPVKGIGLRRCKSDA
ncbi:hypothetical protein D3C86_1476860 [compost metagenome]